MGSAPPGSAASSGPATRPSRRPGRRPITPPHDSRWRRVKPLVAGVERLTFVGASVGAFHVCPWTLTMTEAWAWGREAEDLVDRSASPWDDPARRPSQRGQAGAWRRELLGEEIRAVLRPGVTEAEIQAAAERLLSLAA
jgi:hypothetical protein